MRKTPESSQIYSVAATVNKISIQHKYMKVRLNGMPIKMLVDCGSNVTIITAEVFNKIKFKGNKLASSAEKLMDCQRKFLFLENILLKLKLGRITNAKEF